MKHFLLLLFFNFSLSYASNIHQLFKNACPTPCAYTTLYINSTCYYYSDMELDTPALLQKYIGEYETHRVTTEDGYNLVMFRVPHPNPKKVLFLHHPLITNSRIWIGQGTASLAYHLHNAGYELWLGNARGTHFSDTNTIVARASPQFFNFSMDQIARYDVPAQLGYIRTVSQADKVSYVAHSMGTTIGLIFAAIQPQLANELIDEFVFMGTAATFKYHKSVLVRLLSYLEPILKLLPLYRLPFKFIFSALGKVFHVLPVLLTLLQAYTNSTTSDPAQYNTDVLNNFDATSLPTIYQLLQYVRLRTRFAAYDYGYLKNVEVYGSLKSPIYPLEKVTIPILFVAGTTDAMTTLDDAIYLMDEVLPPNARTRLYKAEGIGHRDYQIGKLEYKIGFFNEIVNYLGS